MALPMARPVARKGSRHRQFRKRIPEDVLSVLRSMPGWKRRGWGLVSGEINLSLEKERKPGETDKGAHLRLGSEAESFFSEVRQGARPLSDEEIAALAGEAYALATSIGDTTKQGARRKSFDLFEYAAEVVAEKGILTDAASLSRLVTALIGEQGALIAAVELNEARGAGDYRKPPEAFPQWPQAAPKALLAPGSSLKLGELVERFLATEHPRIKANTKERYKPALLTFVAFTRNPFASAVTEENIRAFKQHRLSDGQRTEATYYRADLPAIKSMFKWATDRERHVKPLLTDNPAANVRVLTDAQLGRSKSTRDRFYDDEVQAILRGALAVRPAGRDPLLAAAKRWCPWVAAYTGARIASITGLKREDVRKDGDIWFFTFPPEKGCPRFREVPIHPHLIEQGFIEFLESRKDGPLFYSPARKLKASAASSPAQIRAHKLAAWVRNELGVARETVAPNHGWRHTFKTRAQEAGILASISDAITGHSLAAQGPARSVYEHTSLRMLADAMRRFPRYEL